MQASIWFASQVKEPSDSGQTGGDYFVLLNAATKRGY